MEHTEIAAASLSDLALDLANEFQVFVMGPGKSGKSSLVNALVGARVAEEDVLPRTWKIDVFHAAAAPQVVTLRFRDGRTQSLTPDQAKQLLSGEEERAAANEKSANEEFRAKAEGLAPRARRELFQLIRKKHLQPSEIVEVDWPIHMWKGISGFSVVDTPGLRQDLNEHMIASVREFYPRADGVVWVTDGTVVASAGTRILLDQLSATSTQLGESLGNVICAVTRLDLTPYSDLQDNPVINQVRSSFGGVFLDVVGISSAIANKAWETGDGDLLRKSGQTTLCNSIRRHFRQRGTEIRCRAKANGARLVLQDVANAWAKYADRLEEDSRLLSSRRLDSTLSVSNLRDKARASISNLCASWAKTVVARADEIISSLWSHSTKSERIELVRKMSETGALFDEATGIIKNFRDRIGDYVADTLPRILLTEYRDIPREWYAARSEVNFRFHAASLPTNAFDKFGADFNWHWVTTTSPHETLDKKIGGLVMDGIVNASKRAYFEAFERPTFRQKLIASVRELESSMSRLCQERLDRVAKEATEFIGGRLQDSFAALHSSSSDARNVARHRDRVSEATASRSPRVTVARLLDRRKKP